MDKSYCALPVYLETQMGYLLYICDDQNSFLSNTDGVIEKFSSRDASCQRATQLGFLVQRKNWLKLDLDKLQKWLLKPIKKRISCVRFLNLWNIFDDFASQTHLEFDLDHTETQFVYDKLFCGCNFPSMTPRNRFYVPIWSDEEVEIIRCVLGAGLKNFRDYQFNIV